MEKRERSRWSFTGRVSFTHGTQQKRALEMVELGNDPREYMKRKRILDENIRLAEIAAESQMAKGKMMRSSSAKDLLEMTRSRRMKARQRFGGAILAVTARNHMLKMMQAKRNTSDASNAATWSREFDDKSGKYFFRNEATKEIVWAQDIADVRGSQERGATTRSIRKNPLHFKVSNSADANNSKSTAGNSRKKFVETARRSRHIDEATGKAYWYDKDTAESVWE